MKEAKEAKTREPLATPFEAAQLAVSLAIMKGIQTPDLTEAIDLLKQAAFKIEGIVRPKIYHPDVIYTSTTEDYCYPHPSTKIVSPKTDPEGWKNHVKKIQQFPGGDQIKMPKGHLTLMQVIAATTGRGEKKRNQKVLDAMVQAGMFMGGTDNFMFYDELGFWNMARAIAPFAPRFRHLYLTPSAAPKRDARGRIFAPRKSKESGKFIQNKKG